MKRKIILIAVGFAAIFYSCKQKKKNDYFPALSFISSQVKDVDTSLYSIIRADKIDSTWDTTYIKRENFRSLAHDFLETPDLANYSIGKKYKEDKFYDESMNRVILTYTPIKENVEIQKEEIIIIPGTSGDDKMKSIIIEKIKDEKDSTVYQHLLWQVDEKFQIVTIVEKKGKPVSTNIIEVSWNKLNQ